MAERATIGVLEVQQIGARLEQKGPPTRPEMSKRQAIEALQEPIEKLQEQGYSLEEIAKELGVNGLPISAGVLRVYLRKAPGAKRKRPSRSNVRDSAVQAPKSGQPADEAEGKAGNS
jgi:hypothetical protein